MTAPMPKDNEVDEKVPVYVVTAPERIYLQVADDAYYAEDPFPAEEEVTWCADSVMELEVSYVREDLHAATVAELLAEVERLRKSNELYSFAMNTAGIDELKRRADAAERRVGDLIEADREYDLAAAALLACTNKPAHTLVTLIDYADEARSRFEAAKARRAAAYATQSAHTVAGRRAEYQPMRNGIDKGLTTARNDCTHGDSEHA